MSGSLQAKILLDVLEPIHANHAKAEQMLKDIP
jgi:hypothetical protein